MKPNKSYNRFLDLHLPPGQSTFFLGARKTGKSYYLKARFPNSIYYDLLETDEYIRLIKSPHLLREEVLALDPEKLKEPIIIEEIQKAPLLLDEVHWLIENSDAYFILCGSSARKLHSTGVNLLGGRAWRQYFYPLVYPEIPDFDILKALNHGLIPSHYDTEHWKKSVRAYVNNYLVEEIKAENLTRNLAGFARFLDVAAYSNGELINYANIAQDCSIDAKTVKEYYQILEDTLLGYFINPYRKTKKRSDLVSASKFYLLDTGIVTQLTKRSIGELRGAQAGSAIEHYILMEIIAYRGLNDLEFDIHFWRTRGGYEVDFILGDAEVGIEVKIGDSLRKTELKGILEFQKSYSPKRAIVVCNTPKKRALMTDKERTSGVELWPYQLFLDQLWAGKVI